MGSWKETSTLPTDLVTIWIFALLYFISHTYSSNFFKIAVMQRLKTIPRKQSLLPFPSDPPSLHPSSPGHPQGCLSEQRRGPLLLGQEGWEEQIQAQAFSPQKWARACLVLWQQETHGAEAPRDAPSPAGRLGPSRHPACCPTGPPCSPGWLPPFLSCRWQLSFN